MTTSSPKPTSTEWVDQLFASPAPRRSATPAFEAKPTPTERRADERTQLVREMTDVAAEKRQAATARLRALRLQKEADDRASAAQELPKKARSSKKF